MPRPALLLPLMCVRWCVQLVLDLLRLLDGGAECKRLADACADACAQVSAH